jgi:hypothetical protein
MGLIDLLEHKKRCLEKLLNQSEAFLKTKELESASSIQSFCTRRENLLITITLFNRKIEECTSSLQSNEKTESLIQAVTELLKQEEQLISAILQTSQDILIKIYLEKDRLFKDLILSEKSQKTLDKFKSKWLPESGAKLDGKL